MACGRAVACSDTTAIPEVADSAAILFDPYSTAEMTRAILDLMLDRELRRRMGKLGLSRAQQFNWRKAAAQTLEVYHAVAGRREALVAPRKAVAALR
jgi:alpha-1,3-rhamnosyl/mannosyltransferase